MKRVLSIFLSAALLVAAVPVGMAQEVLQSYVVVMNPGNPNVPAVAQEMARVYGGRVGFVYQYALRGFSFEAPARAATALASDPRVAYVEEDMPRSIFSHAVPTGIQRIFADTNANISIDGTDDFRVDVDVAVIDTGIDFEHWDLNVAGGVDCSGGGPFNGSCESGGDDNHYHGTHVAGSIGAIDNGVGVAGVAPGARLWAVKVLNNRGSGYSSWIIAGIDWVAANADTIEVANMSLGGSGFSQGEYDAIQGAVNAGVAFAVAAGNSKADASNYSPAAFDNVLTVSALADFDGAAGGLGIPGCRDDQDDTLADFSNWGNAVGIAAPGVCILSTYPIEQGELGTISGTSMASPHVAGALALLASTNNPQNAADVFGLYDQVINAGNSNWTDDSGDGTKEPLLDVSSFTATLLPSDGESGSGGGDGGDSPPLVSIDNPSDGTSVSSDVSISFAGSASDDEDGNLTSGLVWTSDLDEVIGTGDSFSAFLSEGTHLITASVTDSGLNTGTDSITVFVTAPSAGGDFPLSVNAYKDKGTKYADLNWSSTSATSIDIYRDGNIVTTTANDGEHTDTIGKGGGTHSWYVCEAGTPTCSNTVSFSW